MSTSEIGQTRPRGGLMDKRRAILAGALTVFARDGYTRASIDSISSAAGVSTRTIYNHFEDKADLFRTVIQESATRIAEVQVELVNRHLGDLKDPTTLESDLVAFGCAWITPMPDYADHSALVRQVNVEIRHIPPAAIDAWQRTGPLRVRRELAHHLRRLADRGLLHIEDSDLAALHFGVLISTANPSLPGASHTEEEVAATVRAGVHAFLHGHLARQ
jgi:AcrR family transcriptional regulator